VPAALNDLRVRLEDGFCFVDGQRVGGLLFRCPAEAHFSRSFEESERSSADAEPRALWLAALHSKSVKAINRQDAAAWFDDSSWVVWRRRLAGAGVAVSSFAFGNEHLAGGRFWLPHYGVRLCPAPQCAVQRPLGAALTSSEPARTHLLVCGELLPDGARAQGVPASVPGAGRVLARGDISIAELTTDEEGSVLWVDTVPHIADTERVERASELIAGTYLDHLRLWRNR